MHLPPALLCDFARARAAELAAAPGRRPLSTTALPRPRRGPRRRLGWLLIDVGLRLVARGSPVRS